MTEPTTARAADPFWERVRTLFHAAVEMSPDERRALLDAQCGDARLRSEVEQLLAQHDGSAGFLDQSLWELVDGADNRWERTLIGPYRVVRPLARGGMGAVFLAARDDAQFEQRAAIKLMRRGAGGEAMLARFRQERQILAGLEHPNIARLIDGGTTSGGVPYLVMEYVEGTPIDVYCREHELTVEARLRLFLQLCDAVQYAHRSLIIHRDIKPANVLVTTDGIPKLLDFGIAKLTTGELPQEGTVTRLMTPDYASPEQLLGRPVTTATDVYSLGLLLFELLTGQRPFAGVERAAASEPPRASSVAGQRALRGDLDRILLVALDPDPLRRYGSVQQLADDVRRHLDGHPVLARGPSLAYHATKFVRRNRVAVAVAMLAVVMMIAAFVAIVRQVRIAEHRFQQVRSLAHAVVFDLHDAIARLPGSTPARELLVRNALGYLDALSSEAANNTPLQMELAAAYQRVGDVQGLPYQPNLGDSAGALASYAKGLAAAGAVRAREAQNPAAARLLADLHDRAGLVEQRRLHFRGALAHHEEARRLRESVPRDPAAALALARTWVAIADCLYLSGTIHPVYRDTPSTPRAAYENATRILARVPPQGPYRKELLTEIGRANQRLGGYFTGQREHDPERALQHHEIARRALEERAALDPSDAVARRNYADHLVMMATLQNRTGDGAGALQGTTQALAVLQELAHADADNVEAQQDLAFGLEQLGAAQITLGRWNDASTTIHQALAIRERLVAAHPMNGEVRRNIAALYGYLSTVERRRGNTEGADVYRARGRAVLEASQ
jgi:tetratricopeptide (TPR) repeat protein